MGCQESHLPRSEKRCDDSYAVSQEFCEWITSLYVYPEGIQSSTIIVPDFNQENRTS